MIQLLADSPYPLQQNVGSVSDICTDQTTMMSMGKPRAQIKPIIHRSLESHEFERNQFVAVLDHRGLMQFCFVHMIIL